MVPRALLAASAALLLLIAGCSGAVPSSSSADGVAESTNGIDVTATATASAPPDLAVVRVAVVATAPDADAARGQVAADVATMREALRSAGVRDDGVRTTYFRLSPVYESTRDGRELVGYRAAHGFAVETDVDRAGTVIDTAVAEGATEVEGVEFTLTEETRRTVRSQALGRAMANAREDADALADAGDVTITGVRSASTADVGVVPFDARLAEAGAGGSTVIEPGPVTVSVTVAVSYRIEPAG